MSAKRLPFDSLGVRAVVHELQPWIGARAQKFVQRDDLTVQMQLYKGGAAWLLLSADPDFPRLHLSTRLKKLDASGPTFATELRRRLEGASLTAAVQRGFDRIVDLWFETDAGSWVLVVEIMGKHSNVILVDPQGRCAAPMKSVGITKSRRPVLVGRPYLPPPFEERPSLLEAREGDELKDSEGAAPFTLEWIRHFGLEAFQRAARANDYHPVFAPNRGAYPLSIGELGEAVPRESFSIAVEQAAEEFLERVHVDRRRQSLLGQLKRVRLARELAIRDLQNALDTARGATALQQRGELILAYAYQIKGQDTELDVIGYDGEPLTIALKPDLTPVENAERYFTKAKKAKAGQESNRITLERLEGDLAALDSVMFQIESTDSEQEIDDLAATCRAHRWLHQQVVAASAAERPFEGFAVRETTGPGGWRILYGDNATANDYLTHRVAKPNDWWLHVRGAVSAHAIIPTGNQPTKVPKETLLAAAELVVRNSPSKHSSYVAVDYTLKKHVRKPRGAPPGTALYTHEKTLHVDLK
ncbi:MAG: putative protein YloA [Fimbriimonadaceae bacterium]|nr:putative protein YloA [Fimbriimonadaceae bacterium]